MNGVSLFSGCGGFDSGFLAAGHTVISAYELDQSACDAYTRVTGHSNIQQADLTRIDYATLLDAEIYFAGPPCQDFSRAGKNHGESGVRNMWPTTIEIIKVKRPTLFVFENVPNLTQGKHQPYFLTILKELEELDYRVEWRILNAADYGVSQTRKRVFIVGRRDKQAWVWPAPTHHNRAGWGMPQWVSCGSVLADWIKSSPQPASLPEWILRKYPRKGFWESMPENGYFSGQEQRHEKQHRLLNEPAFTVVASNHQRERVLIDDGRIFRVDVHAKALLQGLPPVGLSFEQIGNAVPPMMAQRLFESMERAA